MNRMNRISLGLCLITLLLPSLVVAEEIAIPDRDIIAAYPLDQPIANIGEIRALDNIISGTPLLHRNNALYRVDLRANFHRKLPRGGLTWMVYDKTAHRLIVSASARYHYVLGGLIKREYTPVILRQDCAVYEVPTKLAKTLTFATFPDLSQLPPPVITASAQTTSWGPNEFEKRDYRGKLNVKCDSYFSPQILTVSSNLTLTIHLDGVHRTLITSFSQEPFAPIVLAVGSATGTPNRTLIAVFTVSPISKFGEPMVNGRICLNPSEFLIFAFGKLGRPLADIDPKGVKVFGYPVAHDFIPLDQDETPAQPATIQAVRGTSLENLPLVDASPNLESRGVPFGPNDWAVIDPTKDTLHVRSRSSNFLDLVEVLVGYYAFRHGHCGGPSMRLELTTQSRSPDKKPALRKHHHFCSIPSTYGNPSRLTISENDEEIAKIEFDPTMNGLGVADLSLQAHFPITSDGNSTFRIDETQFVLSPDHPFLIDTGIDRKDGSSLWLEIGVRNFHAELPTPK